MYFWRSSEGPVDLAFTDRYGGASAVPFDELNLAVGGDDDPAVTAANLALVVGDFAPGDAVAQMSQVHGAEVALVGDPGERPRCDALVSDRSGVVLVVRVADCVPVLLADGDTGVIGAVHSGRPGLAAGVVPAALEQMRRLGADRITAWVGPHVCGGCYEVPEAMRDEVAAVVPESAATTSWGTPSLDLGAGVRAQLAAHDVVVHEHTACTRESTALYSYRRDGRGAGRFAGLVRRRS